jgi:RNA polymerase sigma-70 factor (ECF subfamily)
MSDEKLMSLVKKGKLDALSDLFERHHVKLFNFFLRLTHDASLSEDLVQNVFERIIKYRRSYRGDASFKAWMYQIARNVRTDHYRLNRVKIDDGVQPGQLNLATGTHQEEMEKRERDQELERAIMCLKPEYREVLMLGWFEKMSYAEVGEIMGLTVSNVKVRIHRAIKQLRSHYNKTSCL